MSKHPDGGLRELILDQATRFFATRGFAGTSIRELAEACSCTKPALYYYYRSKEVLFREVVEHHEEKIGVLISSTLEGPGCVRERLHRGLDGMIDYCQAQPHAMRLFQRLEFANQDSEPHVDTSVSKDAHLQLIAQLIRIGIDSGELRADLDPLDGALVVAGALHFQLEQSIATGEWDSARMHRTTDLVLDGIAV